MQTSTFQAQWRGGAEVEVFHNPRITELRDIPVLRFVLFADNGFVAGDANHFLHADTREWLPGTPVILGGYVDFRYAARPILGISDSALVARGRRRYELFRATDAYENFFEGQFELEDFFLVGVDDPQDLRLNPT